MIGMKRRASRIGLGWPVLCASPIMEVVIGVKDLHEKNLFERNDVFASLINALFLLKIKPNDLDEWSPPSVYATSAIRRSGHSPRAKSSTSKTCLRFWGPLLTTLSLNDY